MTDRDALLAAIHAAPDDDAPRLVFADWLDENGHPERAEFIRTQIEMKRERAVHNRLTPRLDELFVRQRDLFRQPWADVLHEAGAGLIGHYSRGWPTGGFSMSADRFPALAPRLVRWFGTLARLFLYGCAGKLDAVAAAPSLNEVESLHLGQIRNEPHLREADVEQWCRSKHLGNLRHLQIGSPHVDQGGPSRLDPEACSSLADAGFGRLVSLNLWRVPIGDAGLERLLQGGWVRSLRDLNLEGTHLTERAVDLLIDSPLPDQMGRLTVYANSLPRRALDRLTARFGEAVNRPVGRGETG